MGILPSHINRADARSRYSLTRLLTAEPKGKCGCLTLTAVVPEETTTAPHSTEPPQANDAFVNPKIDTDCEDDYVFTQSLLHYKRLT